MRMRTRNHEAARERLEQVFRKTPGSSGDPLTVARLEANLQHAVYQKTLEQSFRGAVSSATVLAARVRWLVAESHLVDLRHAQALVRDGIPMTAA